MKGNAFEKVSHFMCCVCFALPSFPVFVCKQLNTSFIKATRPVHTYFCNILTFNTEVRAIFQHIFQNKTGVLIVIHMQMHRAFTVQRGVLISSNEKKSFQRDDFDQSRQRIYAVSTCTILSAQETSEWYEYMRLSLGNGQAATWGVLYLRTHAMS